MYLSGCLHHQQHSYPRGKVGRVPVCQGRVRGLSRIRIFLELHHRPIQRHAPQLSFVKRRGLLDEVESADHDPHLGHGRDRDRDLRHRGPNPALVPLEQKRAGEHTRSDEEDDRQGA